MRRACFASFSSLTILTLTLTSAGCSSSSDDSAGSALTTHEVQTTADHTYALKHAKMDPSKDSTPNPALIENLPALESAGFGEIVEGAGEAYTARTFDGSPAPKPGANAKRLLRFVHMADLQIADDESPTRVGTLDTWGSTSSALRTQDANLCAMTNAAVRTVNELNKKDPIEFVLMGGDNADSAQSNELSWVLGMLSGGSVECDSGDDDDIVAGPGNDGKDPFDAPGFDVPWKWVTGNHDVLVQGNFKVTDAKKAEALGTNSTSGTRVYYDGQAGEVLTGDVVIADPKRELMDRSALMTAISKDSDGHGVGTEQVAAGKAFYSYDAPGTPIRFMVLDTGAETGGAEGIIHQADVDKFVKPALDDAKANNKLVILASHHSIANITLDGSTFGEVQPDAVSADDWKTFISSYGNVVFSMVGHSHQNQVRAVQTADGKGWWEVMTAAIADYPHQFRTIEIFDEDNGWIRLRATCVDFDDQNDVLAHRGRVLGAIDHTSGWLPGDPLGKIEDRNVDLYIKKP